MKWINKHYKVLVIILLVITAILFAIFILIKAWEIFSWGFDTTKASTVGSLLNDFLTPIGTIITVILVFLAYRLTVSQTQIVLSQNIKSHIDRDFDRVKSDLEKEIKGTTYAQKVSLLKVTG